MKLERWNPDDLIHHKLEQMYWRRSLTVGWATVIAAFGGLITASAAAYFAYQAMDATRIQANAAQETLELSGRAWISPTGDSINTFNVNSWAGGLEIQHSLSLHNYGNSPALNVFVHGVVHVFAHEGPLSNSISDEKEACYQADKYEKSLGAAIFPGEERSVPSDSIIKLNKLIPNTSNGQFAVIIVSLCIRYSVSNKFRHTAFDMILFPKKPPFKVDSFLTEGDLIRPDLRGVDLYAD